MLVLMLSQAKLFLGHLREDNKPEEADGQSKIY